MTQRISDQVSDKSGQFAKGSLSFSAINDMANGERHNLELELRRRAVKQMAARMSELLEREAVDGCYLGAAREMNQMVLDALAGPVRERIQKNLAVNLTRPNPSEIISHFAPRNVSKRKFPEIPSFKPKGSNREILLV